MTDCLSSERSRIAPKTEETPNPGSVWFTLISLSVNADQSVLIVNERNNH